MKRFLMCAPDFFEVRYVINPWMEGNLGQVNKALAGCFSEGQTGV